MRSKTLFAVLATLVLLIAGVMSGPAFSGEHPWDSDRTEGGRGPNSTYVSDTLTVKPDSVTVVTTAGGTNTAPAPVLLTIIRTSWAALMAM